MGDYIQLVDSKGKRIKSKLRPVCFSFRKAETASRNRGSHTPCGMFDFPVQDWEIELARKRFEWLMLGDESVRNEYYQREIGDAIYRCY